MNIRLKAEEQIRLLRSDDIYFVMQRILMRENKIDRNREHLWVISLDNVHKILNIELVSMGSVNRLIVEPMEVFSVPLQKRAVKIVMVHNHPSGELKPSSNDREMTDMLLQCGMILNVPLVDHLIITEKSYYSFADSGLLNELGQSKKYVPDYLIKEEIKEQVEQKARAMAKAMKENREPVEKIMQYTGLSKEIIQRIKVK